MALEGIVKDLWDAADAITESGADFKAVRERVILASDAIRGNYARGAAEGIAAIDKTADFSKIYLQAFGVKYETGDEKRDKDLYKLHMKRILGRNYDNFLQAIKSDDLDNALMLAKNAVVADNFAAGQDPIIEKIGELSMAQKEAWAKHAAERIGGNDYMKILENLPAYFATLMQIKALAQPYITPAPAAH